MNRKIIGAAGAAIILCLGYFLLSVKSGFIDTGPQNALPTPAVTPVQKSLPVPIGTPFENPTPTPKSISGTKYSDALSGLIVASSYDFAAHQSSQAFTIKPDGQVFTIKPDGTDKRILTSEGSNMLPAWSWDGTQIAYMSQKQGEQPQIWTMDADGKHKKQLTFAPATQGAVTPAFSPDSTRIVFSSVASGHPEIWVMNSDGTNQRRLTTTTVGSMTRTGNRTPLTAIIPHGLRTEKAFYSSLTAHLLIRVNGRLKLGS